MTNGYSKIEDHTGDFGLVGYEEIGKKSRKS
jgi:hypothetical protein